MSLPTEEVPPQFKRSDSADVIRDHKSTKALGRMDLMVFEMSGYARSLLPYKMPQIITHILRQYQRILKFYSSLA